MKIVAHTPTELIIRDSALGLRAFGACMLGLVLLVVGLGLTQDPGGTVGVVPALIAAVLGVIGLSMHESKDMAEKIFNISRVSE